MYAIKVINKDEYLSRLIGSKIDSKIRIKTVSSNKINDIEFYNSKKIAKWTLEHITTRKKLEIVKVELKVKL